MQLEVSPKELYPGDAFSVRITGAETSQQIDAFIENRQIPLAGCGSSCIIGIGVIDPDAKSDITTVVVHVGSKEMTAVINVKEAEYPVQHIRLPDRQVTLGAEDLKRTKKEAARLNEFWKLHTDRLFDGEFILPLANPVATVYGARRIFNNKTVSIHGGIDIKGAEGEAIKASNRGRVVLAENLFFGGNTIIIDHGLGIYTIYMHLKQFEATPGQLVSKGDIIGLVGSTGRATGPHLHFGAKIMATNANPLSLINLKLQ
jgi:murein DD-endopeptidase MepM/ murein hydrolase activator NlpD